MVVRFDAVLGQLREKDVSPSPDLSGYVPYSGAVSGLELGNKPLTTTGSIFAGAGSFTGAISCGDIIPSSISGIGIGSYNYVVSPAAIGDILVGNRTAGAPPFYYYWTKVTPTAYYQVLRRNANVPFGIEFGKIDYDYLDITTGSLVTNLNADTVDSYHFDQDLQTTGSPTFVKVTTTGGIDAKGGAVFNEDSADVDFRVESNNHTHMLFVDGGVDCVGIATGSPSSNFQLDVNGATQVKYPGATKITSRILGPKYPAMQVTGGGTDNENMPASIMLFQTSMDTTSDRGPELYFVGTRSTDTQVNAGTFTTLTARKNIGRMYFGGDNGVTMRGYGAMIAGYVPATWSSTSTPGELYFYTCPNNSTGIVERMAITASGNVGIGGNPKNWKLYTYSDAALNVAANFFNDGNNTNRYGIQVRCGSDNQAVGTNHYLIARDGGNNEVGGLRNNGGTFQVYDVSDESFKEDIKPTTLNAVEKIKQINVIDYSLKQEIADKSTGVKTIHTGITAQQLGSVFPNAVALGATGSNYFIAKTELIIPLLKAVQEQQEQISGLAFGFNDLLNRVEKLENAKDIS